MTFREICLLLYSSKIQQAGNVNNALEFKKEVLNEARENEFCHENESR